MLPARHTLQVELSQARHRMQQMGILLRLPDLSTTPRLQQQPAAATTALAQNTLIQLQGGIASASVGMVSAGTSGSTAAAGVATASQTPSQQVAASAAGGNAASQDALTAMGSMMAPQMKQQMPLNTGSQQGTDRTARTGAGHESGTIAPASNYANLIGIKHVTTGPYKNTWQAKQSFPTKTGGRWARCCGWCYAVLAFHVCCAVYRQLRIPLLYTDCVVHC